MKLGTTFWQRSHSIIHLPPTFFTFYLSPLTFVCACECEGALPLCYSQVSPVPAELTLCTATWLQAPGAAPQSTTLWPGWRSRNLSSISSSLKALLQRKLSAWEALTYGSLSCRSTQRCSAGVLPPSFFIRRMEVWTYLL